MALRSLPGVPFKLTPEDMGRFDLSGALSSGFDTFNKLQEAKYKPKNLAEALLASQLSNKIQGVNAKYAEPMAQAGLQLKQGEVGMQPYQRNLLEAQARRQGQLANQTGIPLTGAVKTLHQNIVGLTPKAIKAIDSIIDKPSPFEPSGFGLGNVYYPDQRAAHKKAVAAAAENYAKSQGWPNTKGSIEKAEKILERGTLESDESYRRRLKGYQEELKRNQVASQNILNPNQAQATEEPYTTKPGGAVGEGMLMQAPDGTQKFVSVNNLEKARSLGLIPVQEGEA